MTQSFNFTGRAADASFDFKIDGIDALAAKFSAVSYDIQRKGGRAALRKAAKVVEDAARAGALRIDDQQTAEQIARNVTLRWNGRLFKRTGDLGFRVGVLGGARAPQSAKSDRRRARSGTRSLAELGEIPGRGKGNPGGDTWYWRLVEFGTSKVGAKPFLRPALEQNVAAVTSTFVREYTKAIDRAVKRQSKAAE